MISNKEINIRGNKSGNISKTEGTLLKYKYKRYVFQISINSLIKDIPHYVTRNVPRYILESIDRTVIIAYLMV